MHKLFLSLLIIFTSGFLNSIHACDNQEAQFIGKVKNYKQVQRSESTSECFYEIEYTMFNSSYVCPLDIDEVSRAQFQDYDCKLKNGDQVSGVMAEIDGQIILE